MWSDSPPVAVDALRTMLVACPSAIAFGLEQANFHYPAAALGTDDTTAPDPRPLCVINEESAGRTPYCEPGVAGLPNGSLIASIYSEGTTGELETLADSLCNELLLIVSGLPNISASRTRAKEPSAGDRAAAADTGEAFSSLTAIDITVAYGLKG